MEPAVAFAWLGDGGWALEVSEEQLMHLLEMRSPGLAGNLRIARHKHIQ